MQKKWTYSLFLLFLIACKKEVVTEKIIIEKVISSETSTEENRETIEKPEAQLIYTSIRKTLINTDGSNFLNSAQFLRDLNKRTVQVERKHSPLNNGQLKCIDISIATSPKKLGLQNFNAEGNLAYLDFKISDNNLNSTTIACEVLEDGQKLANSYQVFTFYPDLLIEGTSSAEKLSLVKNALNKIDTLIILENSTLETLGGYLKLDIDQLIAFENAKIVSFAQEENITAAKNSHGKDGGFLELNAKKAFGELKIIMNGQNAGTVSNTPDAPTNYPAEYSHGILDGVVEIVEDVRVCDDRYDRPICQWEPQTIQMPTSGRDGLTGVKGATGFNGFNGGNSGIAKVTVITSDFFNLTFDLIPGLESMGGEGSMGGPGTPGGNVHCSPRSDYCKYFNVKKGNPGAQGPMGERGLPGKKGSIQSAEYINNSTPEANQSINVYNN